VDFPPVLARQKPIRLSLSVLPPSWTRTESSILAALEGTPRKGWVQVRPRMRRAWVKPSRRARPAVNQGGFPAFQQTSSDCLLYYRSTRSGKHRQNIGLASPRPAANALCHLSRRLDTRLYAGRTQAPKAFGISRPRTSSYDACFGVFCGPQRRFEDPKRRVRAN